MRFGRRPAGYAFVSYKKEEDAKKVVEELNDKGTFSCDELISCKTKLKCLA